MRIILDSQISTSYTASEAVIAGAVAGAVGGATFGLSTAVVGTGLVGTVVSGAVNGVVAGQAAIATGNVLSGREVTAGLGNPSDIAQDAVVGAVMAGVARSVDTALIRTRYPDQSLQHCRGSHISVGFTRSPSIPCGFSDYESTSDLRIATSPTLDLALKAWISCWLWDRVLDDGSS